MHLLELTRVITALVEEVEPDVEAMRTGLEFVCDVGRRARANVPLEQDALQDFRCQPLDDPVETQVAALAESILQIDRTVEAQHLGDHGKHLRRDERRLVGERRREALTAIARGSADREPAPGERACDP